MWREEKGKKKRKLYKFYVEKNSKEKFVCAQCVWFSIFIGTSPNYSLARDLIGQEKNQSRARVLVMPTKKNLNGNNIKKTWGRNRGREINFEKVFNLYGHSKAVVVENQSKISINCVSYKLLAYIVKRKRRRRKKRLNCYQSVYKFTSINADYRNIKKYHQLIIGRLMDINLIVFSCRKNTRCIYV